MIQGCGLFTINLDPDFPTTNIHQEIPGVLNPIFPHISAAHAAPFTSYLQLFYLSCLQMTDRGLYFTWSLRPEMGQGDLPMSTVYYIDVYPPLQVDQPINIGDLGESSDSEY
jgi:hypothetical protein